MNEGLADQTINTVFQRDATAEELYSSGIHPIMDRILYYARLMFTKILEFFDWIRDDGTAQKIIRFLVVLLIILYFLKRRAATRSPTTNTSAVAGPAPKPKIK
jgi:hypothetical protein